MLRTGLDLQVPSKNEIVSIISLLVSTLIVSIQLRNDVVEEEHFFKFNRHRTTEQFTCTLEQLSYLNRHAKVEFILIPRKADKAKPLAVTSALHIRTDDHFGESTVKDFKSSLQSVVLYESGNFPTSSISINIVCEGKLSQYQGFNVYLTTCSEKNSQFVIWISISYVIVSAIFFYMYNDKAKYLINRTFSVEPLNLIRAIFIITVISNIPEIIFNQFVGFEFLRTVIFASRALLSALLILLPYTLVIQDISKAKVLAPLITVIAVYVHVWCMEATEIVIGARIVLTGALAVLAIWSQYFSGKEVGSVTKKMTMISIISVAIKFFHSETLLSALHEQVVNNVIVFIIGIIVSPGFQNMSLGVPEDLGIEADTTALE